MSIIASAHNAKQAQALEERIDEETIPNIGRDSTGDATATGLVWSLNDHVFKLFAIMVPLVPKTSLTLSKKQARTLKESLGKLFLWGDGFRGGSLDSILEDTVALRQPVLTSLMIAGRALISGFVPACQNVAISSTRGEVQPLVEELNVFHEKAKLVADNDCKSDHDSDNDSNASAVDNSLEDLINSLKICVACLMDLVPSMEDTLSYALHRRLVDSKSASVPLKVSIPAREDDFDASDRSEKADYSPVEAIGNANRRRHPKLRMYLEQQDCASETASGETSLGTEPPEAIKSSVGALNQRYFIIATDFGTNYSSVAFISRQAGQISQPQNITNYPDDPLTNGEKSFEVPTEIWYPAASETSSQLEKTIAQTKNSEKASDIFGDGLEQLYPYVHKKEYDDDGEEKLLNENLKPASDETQEPMSDSKLPSRQPFFWGYEAPGIALSLDQSRNHFRHIARSKFIPDESHKAKEVQDKLRPILNQLKREGVIRKDEDVIADYISQLFLHVKKKLILDYDLSNSDIVELVLCVPNTWSSKACQELEAAAKFVLHDKINFQIKPGETFVIIDAGGTVEATTYTVANENPLRLKREAIEPIGGLFGSSYLNEAFHQYLFKRLEGEHYLETQHSTLEDKIDEAMIDFENRMRSVNFCDDKIKLVLTAKIPGLRAYQGKRFADNYAIIPHGDMNHIFKPLLKGITNLMMLQIRLAVAEELHIQKVILIGGFAASITLREYLKDRLGKISSELKGPIELLTPESSCQPVVSLGAVLRALEKENGPIRIMQSSYGFLRTEPYEPEIFQAHRRVRPTVDKLDGEKYVQNTIDWLVKKGDILPPCLEFHITSIHTFPIWTKRFECEEILYVSDSSTESHYRSSHPMNKGTEEVGRIVADVTFLKTDSIIHPTYPKDGLSGKPHYKVEFELVMIITGRNLRYEARYPAGGNVHGQGQICIAAAFEPGTS